MKDNILTFVYWILLGLILIGAWYEPPRDYTPWEEGEVRCYGKKCYTREEYLAYLKKELLP